MKQIVHPSVFCGLILIAGFVWSCQISGSSSFMSRHFADLKKLEDGLVYTYHVLTDADTLLLYQFHKSVPDSAGYIYTIQSYNEEREVISLETYLWRDSVFRLNQWIEYDNEFGKVAKTRHAAIEQDYFMSWRDTDTLSTQIMEFHLPDSLGTCIRISRNYRGRDNIEWQSQVLPSVIFEVIFERTYQNNKDTNEVISHDEIYAHGIGLVSQTNSPLDPIHKRQLITIQTMDQFLNSKQTQ